MYIEEGYDYELLESCLLPASRAEGYTMMVEEAADADDMIHLVAYDDDGRPVGMLSALIPMSTADVWEITAYVHPDYRRRRVFANLYEELVSIIREEFIDDSELENGGCIEELSDECIDTPAVIVAVVADTVAEALAGSSFLLSEYSREYMLVKDTKICGDTADREAVNTVYGCSNDSAVSVCIKDMLKSESTACICYKYVETDGSMACIQKEYILDESGPDMTGVAAVAYIDISGDTGCLNRVWTREDCRNKGISTAIVKHVLKDVAVRVDRVILHVAGDNRAARRVYEKVGFVEEKCIVYRRIEH